MHNFKRNPITIDDNLKKVGKGLHVEQRKFLNSEEANLKKAFQEYDTHANSAPVSLEILSPIWAETATDTVAKKKEKKDKRDKAFKLYGSNRPFVNAHWEALKAANGGNVLRCPICGQKECTEMDHYMPRSLFQEYSSHTSNLIPLCHDCNQDKHDYWLNSKGERYFFNAFFDKLPNKIIECTISIKNGFPKVKVSIYSGLDKNKYQDAVVLRTITKLDLKKSFQSEADDFLRSEIRRLKNDYTTQRTVYKDDRTAFWKSRVMSYNGYVLYPEEFKFIEVEMYKAIAASPEMKDWVENSAEFLF